MILMGRAFARNMHGGPDFRHILRKFTGLKEGVGENIPNTGYIYISNTAVNFPDYGIWLYLWSLDNKSDLIF